MLGAGLSINKAISERKGGMDGGRRGGAGGVCKFNCPGAM